MDDQPSIAFEVDGKRLCGVCMLSEDHRSSDDTTWVVSGDELCQRCFRNFGCDEAMEAVREIHRIKYHVSIEFVLR